MWYPGRRGVKDAFAVAPEGGRTMLAITVDRRPRLRLRFSLRSLLMVMGACGVVLGLWANRAERQRRAVAAIRAAGGQVLYDFQAIGDEAPYPVWLSSLLPDDYLADPDAVWLPPSATDDHLRPVGELTSLRRLSLGGAGIGEAGLSHLTDLKDLEELFLDGVRMRGAGLEPTSAFPLKRTAGADGMELTRFALAHIGELTGIKILSLRGTILNEEGLRSLRRLPHLRELDLSYTRIRMGDAWRWLDDAEIEDLRDLDQLEFLDLSRSRVGDASVTRLVQFKRLKKLVLSNAVSDAGYEQLQWALPACRIQR